MIFGQDFDTDRYWDAIERASLVPDLHVLPDGDLTEVLYFETETFIIDNLRNISLRSAKRESI